MASKQQAEYTGPFILKQGEKLLVMYRRRFLGDSPYIYTGIVSHSDIGLVRLDEARKWVHHKSDDRFNKLDDLGTHVVPMGSTSVFVRVLPLSTDMDNLTCEHGMGNNSTSLYLKDGHTLNINIADEVFTNG